MKEKRLAHKITYDEYIEWKFQYKFKEEDKYEEDS